MNNGVENLDKASIKSPKYLGAQMLLLIHFIYMEITMAVIGYFFLTYLIRAC